MRAVAERRAQEAQRLASLTGWNVTDIRQRAGLGSGAAPVPAAWWERLWRR
jgi:hypothetical protein